MAIFRHGVKIGPFDIRAGFTRDKSLDNVAGDVRLKQRANTQNTIGRFRATMAKAEGYARTARFAVKIFPPIKLAELAAEQTTHYGGYKSMTNPTAITMQQLYSQMGEQLDIHCDSVVMPGHDLQTETIDHFGPVREMVVGHGFAGTIRASFYADKYLRERHFLELWQKMAVNNLTHKAGYYDDYIGKMQIHQLGSLDGAASGPGAEGKGGRSNYTPAPIDTPTYAIEATEVYPEQIAAINYSYGASSTITKVDVEFQYKQWFNMATDGVGDMEFGASQQTLHDVKRGKTGWLDRLPPELKRVGRDVFNQAKTQVPIGRITKGKIFPPFN